MSPLLRSGHVDPFPRENLPPRESWPALDLAKAGLVYPYRLNVVTELLDAHLPARGAHPAIVTDDAVWSYADLAERVNRIANALTRDLGMVPGNRVLLRAANTPMMVAAYLAVLKAGGVVVATMPMLRAGELVYPLDKARIGLALCDTALLSDLETAASRAAEPVRIVAWNGADAELEKLMAKPGYERFEPADTASDDVALIAFTSAPPASRKARCICSATCWRSATAMVRRF